MCFQFVYFFISRRGKKIFKSFLKMGYFGWACYVKSIKSCCLSQDCFQLFFFSFFFPIYLSALDKRLQWFKWFLSLFSDNNITLQTLQECSFDEIQPLLKETGFFLVPSLPLRGIGKNGVSHLLPSFKLISMRMLKRYIHVQFP